MTNFIEELEFAGGNGMELNEYIASDEFKKEMKRFKCQYQLDMVVRQGINTLSAFFKIKEEL